MAAISWTTACGQVNYEQTGPGAADRVDRVRQLIADLEQRNP